MKFLLLVLVAATLLLGLSYAYADQLVVLDPVSSYELNNRGAVTIPIGATFLEPARLSGDQDFQILVNGLPAGLTFEKDDSTAFRVSGALRQLGQIGDGTYYINITARSNYSRISSSAIMKLKVDSTHQDVNQPIVFDPLEQVKAIKVGTWYSIAIAASDDDGENLSIDLTGTSGNTLGYAKFTQTVKSGGRIGGVLNVMMARPGELKINICVRDLREARYYPNKTVAELHFLVGAVLAK